jgi:hypothetical protein
MKKHHTIALIVFALAMLAVGPALAETKDSQAKQSENLLPGNRVVIGMVEEVKGDQIKVNTGEIQPRFLPLNMAKEKGFPPINKGDKLMITLNEQNLVVDYHPAGDPPKERTVRGALVAPLVVGHDQAVIRTTDGKEASFEVRPLARSKVAGLPIGAEAVFLLDETNQITDTSLAAEAKDTRGPGSPIKGAHTKVSATIIKPLNDGRITVRTEDGKEQRYEIRPLVQEKLADVREGQSVILLIDPENKVIDLAAVPPKKKG